MRIKKIGVVVFALALWFPTLSSATPWNYRLNEYGVGVYNKMEVFMMSPATDFQTPGISHFTYSTWSGKLINPDYAVATGPSLDNSYFDIMFASDKSQPLTFDFLAWNGNTLLERVRGTWEGSNLRLTSISADVNDPSYTSAGYNRTPLADPLLCPGNNSNPVPEPASMFLLGSGLIGLAGWGRKKFFKKETVGV